MTSCIWFVLSTIQSIQCQINFVKPQQGAERKKQKENTELKRQYRFALGKNGKPLANGNAPVNAVDSLSGYSNTPGDVSASSVASLQAVINEEDEKAARDYEAIASHTDPANKQNEYVLNNEYKEAYYKMYEYAYSRLMAEAMVDPRYANFTDVQKAAYLTDIKAKKVNPLVKDAIILQMQKDGFASTPKDVKEKY